jgi:hypothetical protein
VRTLIVAVLTGVAGALIGFFGGDMATRAHNVSDFEGGRGMAIVWLISPACTFAGIIVGIVVAKTVRDPGFTGFVKAQGIAILTSLILASGVFGYAIWRAPRPPRLDGQYLDLEFEVRMPEGRTAQPSGDDFTVLMLSRGYGDDRHDADLRLDATGQSGGRVVIPGSAFLYTTTTERFLIINDAGDKHYWFDLPLRAKPRPEDQEWTEWWPKPGESATRDIRGNGGFQIRYRVQKTTVQ